jgi:hypothetical protein
MSSPHLSCATRIAGVSLTVAGSLVVLGVVTVGVGSLLWRRATARQLDLLADQARMQRAGAIAAFREGDLLSLPAPVARYFAFAMRGGQRRIRTARIRWTGEMRLRPDAEWRAITADQHFTTHPAGFVWDARVAMMPVTPVRVRDSYVGGEGRMLGRLGGVIPVVDAGGTRELAEGALARWLGEAVWFPTALLPGGGVTWAPVDDSTARATVTDGAWSVSADFHFAPDGAVTRMTAMRWRDVNGQGVLTPFEGRYASYQRRHGVMIPTSAEVAWILPAGRFAYWRGRPTMIDYDPRDAGAAPPRSSRAMP